MNVKTEFSIKDLENLSGVKAHTIRIWEKRYNLLAPNRTKTNIRSYDINNLKRLLNISYLYKDGYKISKLANLTESDLLRLIKSLSSSKQEDFAIKDFKTAMFEFNNHLFNETYNRLLERKNFSALFRHVFIPLLDEIGMLWQTGTIDPVHESFISELIRQKIIINIAVQQQSFVQKDDQTYILFLPYQEVHEIGLLYASYELIASSRNVIYLGANIPLKNLSNLLKRKDNVVLVTYLTVQPELQSPTEFVQDLVEIMSPSKLSSLWLMGPKTRILLEENSLNDNVFIYNLEEFRCKIGR